MSDVDFDAYLGEQLSADPLAAAEPAVEPESDTAAAEPEVVADEPAAGEQPRGEDGKFVAKDADGAEQRLKEKDRVIGSMAQELGDLRKLVEERVAAPEPQQRYDLSGVGDAILENPGIAPQAAALALQQGDHIAYQQVLRAWHEIDPFAATDFNQRKLVLESQQQLQAQIAPQIATATQLAEREALAEASAALADDYKNFGQVIGALNPDEHEMPARYVQRLEQATTAAEKQDALEDIYFWAERVVGSQKQAATAAVVAEDAAASRELKQQAAVASASSAPATEGTGADNTKILTFDGLTHKDLLDGILAPSPWQRPAR